MKKDVLELRFFWDGHYIQIFDTEAIMNKQDLAFGIIGIVLGLVIGFYFANLTQPSVTATQQAARNPSGQTSVNSGANKPQLPANPPAIEPAKTMPAGPLPEPPAGATGATGSTAEMPALEPPPAS